MLDSKRVRPGLPALAFLLMAVTWAGSVAAAPRLDIAGVDATHVGIARVSVEHAWDAGAFPWSTRFQDPRREERLRSPDGRRLAWRGQNSTAYWLYVSAAAEGSPVRRLKDCRDAYQPVWSPDSRSILYSTVDWRTKERSLRIYEPDADTGSGRRFFSPLEGPTRAGRFENLGALASWSPDGKKIVFNYYGNLWLMNSNGIGRGLLNLAGRIGRPVGDAERIGWSADGRRLAWQMRGERKVYVMDLVRRP